MRYTRPLCAILKYNNMSIPKVFISYSHDSITHKKWVLDLATRMRNNGIDAIIDQWELQLGDDLPHFMETHLANSDKIIMVCTENYVEKANNGTGGVGYEKMIITSNLLKKIDENKIIPIIRQVSTTDLPTFLKTKLYINFSKVSEFEFNFDELIRTIHGSPIYKKPPVGNNPFAKIMDDSNLKVHDSLLDYMTAVVQIYNSSSGIYISKVAIKNKLKLSRIMLEHLEEKALEANYIKADGITDVTLTKAGKTYAINNNIE